MRKLKKIVAVAIIAVLSTLMIFTRTPTAQAYGESSGLNPAYPGDVYLEWCDRYTDGCYSMCEHGSTNFGSYMDIWVSIGIEVRYNDDSEPPNVGYNWANWTFQSASGGYYPQAGYLICTLCIDQIYPQYHNEEIWTTWQTFMGLSGYMDFFIWPTDPLLDPDVKSVEGAVGQVFVDIYNPPLYAYMQAYVQPWGPPERSCLTAWYQT